VGFLLAVPGALPGGGRPHPASDEVCGRLAELMREGNPYAVQLARLLGGEGQAFLETVEMVLDKPSNQDVVVSLLHAIAAYFRPIRVQDVECRTMEDILTATDGLMACASVPGHPLRELLDRVPAMESEVRAMLVLSLVDEPLVNPIFSRTDAIGTVMRRKLKPLFEQMQQYIDTLRNR
jgi:hypothetical protein